MHSVCWVTISHQFYSFQCCVNMVEIHLLHTQNIFMSFDKLLICFNIGVKTVHLSFKIQHWCLSPTKRMPVWYFTIHKQWFLNVLLSEIHNICFLSRRVCFWD
ncbi:hypothetical protein FOCC_FOCC006126 [Frankliniella occidentalis]|nr:hypothetical protein FOCC_FOCC006126 [Frankliniella occidentalis]